ncbi:hypothetical protein BDW67DRAFT_49662 [Aspergillus spinulosporus]
MTYAFELGRRLPPLATAHCALSQCPGFDFALKIETRRTVSLTETVAIRSRRWNLPASATPCLVLFTFLSSTMLLPLIAKLTGGINDHRARQKLDWKAMG